MWTYTGRYLARDDKSGVGSVSYRLLDPLGGSHFDHHYHDNFYTDFFKGDPTVWATYTISIILPKGCVASDSLMLHLRARTCIAYRAIQAAGAGDFLLTGTRLAWSLSV